MRNAVAHGYFQVDLDIVWTTIITDLPSLAALVRGLLAGSA
ncbi:HepT-like ribonuclease domain-containing protein [Gryllotalpicola koreensis]